MCHKRLLFGLDSPSSMLPIDISAASTPILGPSRNRYGIVLGAPLAGTITYAPNVIAVAGNGLVVAAGQTDLVLSAETHGNIVTEQWFAFADAANRLAAVVEIMLPNWARGN